MEFKVKAQAGDYLEYDGGKVLRHYDRDYNLLETLTGEGEEIVVHNAGYAGIRFHYTLSGLQDGEHMRLLFKHFRPTRHYEFDVK